jgi:hypothetical protein
MIEFPRDVPIGDFVPDFSAYSRIAFRVNFQGSQAIWQVTID